MMKNGILWDNLFLDKGHAFQLGCEASPCSYAYVNDDSSGEKVLKRRRHWMRVASSFGPCLQFLYLCGVQIK